MDLSLSYRIATMPPVLPDSIYSLPSEGRETMAARVAAERTLISKATSLRVDNVAGFYAAHERATWSVFDDIPNWAPPFPFLFVEWNEPRTWLIDGNLVDNSGAGQAGLMMSAMNVTDRNRAAPEWSLVTGELHGRNGEELLATLPGARWVVASSLWFSFGVKPLFGRPLWAGTRFWTTVAASGKLLFAKAVGYSALSENQQEMVWSPMHIAGLAISFCHCKNVTRTEHTDDRGERFHRREKVPKFKYYVLNIDPMRETLRREGRSGEVGIAKALHICRGHFATYSADHPLFGKYVGTFWRPDHVRGKAEAGVVAKDYGVKVPGAVNA
jgi:hypothetical protein